MEKKKLILISPHDVFPPRDGGERRVYLLTRELTKSRNVIFVGPYLENRKQVDIPLDVVEAFPNKAKYKTLNIGLMMTIRKILRQNPEAEIRLEFPWQGINLLLLGRRFIIDEHNVEFLRFKRVGSWIWVFVYIYEFVLCHLASKVICVSRTDKDYFVKYFRLNPDKIEVVENPVDTTIFFQDAGNVKKIRQELGIKDNERFVLFFGQLDNRPAIEALEIIINKIVPGLERSGMNYKLVICGKGDGKGLLRKFTHSNVIFRGFVERIQDYINASDVIIVPLLSGSGTRMKILESLACGKRVVSTTIGAEGLEKNTLLEIEDDWDRFVEKLKGSVDAI